MGGPHLPTLSNRGWVPLCGLDVAVMGATFMDWPVSVVLNMGAPFPASLSASQDSEGAEGPPGESVVPAQSEVALLLLPTCMSLEYTLDARALAPYAS